MIELEEETSSVGDKFLVQIIVLNEKIAEVVDSNPIKESPPSCFLLAVDQFGSSVSLDAGVAQKKVLDLERVVRILFQLYKID